MSCMCIFINKTPFRISTISQYRVFPPLYINRFNEKVLKPLQQRIITDMASSENQNVGNKDELKLEAQQVEEELAVGLFDKVTLKEHQEPKKEMKPIAFKDFLKQNYEGKLHLLTKDNYNILQRPMLVTVHNFNHFYMKLDKWIEVFSEVASMFSNRVLFALADIEDIELFHQSTKFPDILYLCSLPLIFALDIKNHQFEFYGLREVPSLSDFCLHLFKDELYISEPLPIQDNDSASYVKIVVADNFEAIVTERVGDVFLTFYADWCEVAKEFLPLLDELAFLLRDDRENVTIAKTDAEKNYYPPQYRILKSPHCIFIPRSDESKHIRLALRPRTVEDLIKFVARLSTVELTNYDREGNLKEVS